MGRRLCILLSLLHQVQFIISDLDLIRIIHMPKNFQKQLPGGVQWKNCQKRLQVFFCYFCDFFQNNYPLEQLWLANSEHFILYVGFVLAWIRWVHGLREYINHVGRVDDLGYVGYKIVSHGSTFLRLSKYFTWLFSLFFWFLPQEPLLTLLQLQLERTVEWYKTNKCVYFLSNFHK